MNGAVYISFFQGQLESVLEQVVQLAVQEISKSVGSSLNALLLETAVKEQENRRLRLQLQARSNDGGSAGAAGKNKAGDERGDGGRTKHEPPQQQRAPAGQSTGPGVPIDTRRLEQRGRVVDQLKCVMEQVLDFALRELTKIVEASFDDLLLEITKMEKEQQALQGRLGKGCERAAGGKGRGGRRRGSENDSMSPSGSEEAREELVERSKEPAEEPERPPVLSQDWVPILDKVFGQKWCSDVWQIKELSSEGGGGGGRSLSEGGGHQAGPLSSPSVILQPSPSSPQQDPRWTPLEDMEVFSPDDEDTQRNSTPGPPARPSPGPQPEPPPESPHSPSGGSSSASMLHRLLTLPSQLLDDDDEEAAAKETLVALATNGSSERQDGDAEPPRLAVKEEEEDEDEEEEDGEDKGRKKKRRRVWSECEECGRRFSRMSLLKAHRQSHVAGDDGADASAPSSPPSGATSPLRCSECGKRFSSATRLQSHVRTQHPENRS